MHLQLDLVVDVFCEGALQLDLVGVSQLYLEKVEPQL